MKKGQSVMDLKTRLPTSGFIDLPHKIFIVNFGFRICQICRNQENLISKALSHFEISDYVVGAKVILNNNFKLKERFKPDHVFVRLKNLEIIIYF